MRQQNEILKFAIAGIIVVATDVGIYTLLIHVLPYALAKGVSFTCAGVVAYLVNKYWTFQQKKSSPAEVARFIIANSCALGLNVATNELILKLNENGVFMALAIATLLTSVFTFVVFKYWVFNSPNQ